MPYIVTYFIAFGIFVDSFFRSSFKEWDVFIFSSCLESPSARVVGVTRTSPLNSHLGKMFSKLMVQALYLINK